MLHRLARPLPLRLLLVTLLAMIGLHAAIPASAPLDRIRGSAFSASTVDVVVIREQQDQKDWTRAALPKLDLPRRPILHVPGRAAVRELTGWAPRPDSTGPPTEEILARQPSPRAPPLT